MAATEARIEIVGERRRVHDAAFRAQVVTECLAPGTRVRDLARRHGLCISLIYRWRRDAMPREPVRVVAQPDAAGPMSPGKVVAAEPALGFVPIGVFGRSDDGGPALVARSPQAAEALSSSGHAPLPRPAMEERPGVIEIGGLFSEARAMPGRRWWRRPTCTWEVNATKAAEPRARPASSSLASGTGTAAWAMSRCGSSAPSSEAVAAFRDAHIAPGATVHTDGLRAFNAFGMAGRTHVAIVTGGGRPARERSTPFFTVSTLVANLGTALKATHKRLSLKHLPDYLGAFCWTTNRRRNMRGMVSALCRAVATSSRLTRRSVYA